MRRMLNRFDKSVTKSILRLPAWVRPFMRFATFVGGPVFTVGIGLLLVGAGYGKSNEPLLQAGVVVVLTVVIGSGLKLLLRRNRPPTYVAGWLFATFSFPSGHTVGAVVAYGTLAYLLWQTVSDTGYFFAVLLSTLTLAVGVSRVYLGAHYPSDVVAGWLLGGIGLIVISMMQPAL